MTCAFLTFFLEFNNIAHMQEALENKTVGHILVHSENDISLLSMEIENTTTWIDQELVLDFAVSLPRDLLRLYWQKLEVSRNNCVKSVENDIKKVKTIRVAVVILIVAYSSK